MAEYGSYGKRSSPGSSVNLWLVLLVVGLAGLLGWRMWGHGQDLNGPVDYVPRPITPRGDLASFEQSTIEVFRETSPSVVFIRTKGYQRFLFGGGQEKELSSGTGFVWDDQGHIVTNLHVIREKILSDSTDLEVQFSDGSVVDAIVVGAVERHDIAVLRVAASANQLRPLPLGTSDDLQVGQQVLAIGNPFGFDQTLSTGVIGGLNRSVASEGNDRSLEGLIQTDAAINPGNSGGPLLDSAGRMIGVNTAIVSPTGAYSGLGFAVPVSSVIESVALLLKAPGRKRIPRLGIEFFDSEFLIEQARGDQRMIDLSQRGLFIRRISPSGPAAQTDLRGSRITYRSILLGDQITGVNDQPVRTGADVRKILEGLSPGDMATLSVYRDNRLGTVDVILEEPAPKLIVD